jgi:multidrug efflux system membrane fusion protein
VIKDDMTVEVRNVAVGMTRQGETVVEKGVSAGERVVTDGQLKLTPGAKVKIKDSQQPGDKPGELKERKG